MSDFDKDIIQMYITFSERHNHFLDFVEGATQKGVDWVKTGDRLKPSKWWIVNVWRMFTGTEKFEEVGYYVWTWGI